MENIVIMAMPEGPQRTKKPVGYFSELHQVPVGWKVLERPEFDITDVMEMNGWSKNEALEMMNEQWQGRLSPA